jgi:hypothetical protein
MGIVLALGMLSAGPAALALTDEEVFRDFRFNFIIPGARAQSLGGAYIAAADDATAAEANPAALHYIGTFEAFLEYRSISSQPQVTQSSLGDRSVTSTMDAADFTAVNNPEDQDLITFASFSVPFRTLRSTLAFSYQVLLSAQTSLSAGDLDTSVDVSKSDFPIVVVPQPGGGLTTQRYAVDNVVNGGLDATIDRYNVSYAFDLSRDFSFGITATASELNLSSYVDSVTQDPLGVLNTVHPRVDVGGSFADIQTQSQIDDSDRSYAYTLGLHWHPNEVFKDRPAGSPVRFGVVYRKGEKFEVEQTLADLDPVTQQLTMDKTFTNTIRVPDRFGVGFSYHGRIILVSADVERIKYSDLLDGFQPGVNFFTREPELIDVDPDSLEFDVDDATVFHIGIEAVMPRPLSWPISFRVGYYNDPDNTIRLAAINDPGVGQDVNTALSEAFAGGEDVDHWTAGFSFGTPVGFQLQFAGDFSDVEDQLVVSAVWRFGRIRR